LILGQAKLELFSKGRIILKHKNPNNIAYFKKSQTPTESWWLAAST